MSSSRVRDVSPKFEFTDAEYYERPSSSRYHRILQIVVDLLAIITVLVTFGVVYLYLDPKIAYFYCNDTDLFYPSTFIVKMFF